MYVCLYVTAALSNNLRIATTNTKTLTHTYTLKKKIYKIGNFYMMRML